VSVPPSEADFGVRGRYGFAGNVSLRSEVSPETLNAMRKKLVRESNAVEEACVLEINGALQSVKATCNKKVVIDKVLEDQDRIILETPGMQLWAKGNPKPLFFKFLSDEIFTWIAEAFPNRTQQISFPAASKIDKKLLNDADSKHGTHPDYENRRELVLDPGKALVVVIRPREYDEGFGWGLQEKIHIDDHAEIVNLAGTYSSVQIEPGEHTITGQGIWNQATQLRMNFESGKIYYFLHGSEFLRRVSGDLGQFEMSYAYPSVTQRKPGK